MPSPLTDSRYPIDNVAALIDVMHQDREYALRFRDHAEDHVTLRLRRQFYRAPPALVEDAFNEAFMNLLRSRTFKDEMFQQGRPASGWSAIELVTHVLGGYLFVSARHELNRHWRKHGTGDDPDDAAHEQDHYNPSDMLRDDSEHSDPARYVESVQLVRQVRLCMERLDADDRQALDMYLEQVPIRDIAHHLKEDREANMKTRLHRIRQRVIDCAKRRLR